jgi:aspartate aminotransferase
MARGLLGSEILRIAGEIRTMLESGKDVCNLTVGDFSPGEFRVPKLLEDATREALAAGETNYPPGDGVADLRRAVLSYYADELGVRYPMESVFIVSGSRPGIHSAYTALVDPGDVVVYPVPSWNNNYYCQMTGAEGRPVPCGREHNFLPDRAMLSDAVRGARMLVLNSPSNPTGTTLTAGALEGICDLVLEENERRGEDERPLFLLYDQVYWTITFGQNEHVNPVALRPEMSEYTILVDGISKSFAATGMRVGWVVGPADIIKKMSSIVAHIGAWAPRAEQIATARLLADRTAIRQYSEQLKTDLLLRLNTLHDGLSTLRSEGLPVDSIPPMGAIYLSAHFDLIGKRAPDGAVLRSNEDVRKYLLYEAALGAITFQAFGAMDESGWFRLSAGAVSVDSIKRMLPRLRTAISALS